MNSFLTGYKFQSERVLVKYLSLAFLVIILGGCKAPATVTSSSTPSSIPSEATPTRTLEMAVPTSMVVPTSPAKPTKDLPLAIITPNDTTVEQYGLLELDLQTSQQVENPFDPSEIDIRVQFTSPSGNIVDVGVFWYQDFDLQLRIPEGKPGWKARFTPTEVGDWSAAALNSAKGLESAPVNFQVIESDRHGFVRIHPTNPTYFAFDDGRTFFPIGMNMAWWSGAGNAIDDYNKWMSPFALNGGDLIRVWMADWSFGIEWNDTPLGNYDNRQKRAWYLDQIFKMAEQRDLYIMLTLLNCADFNNWQTNGWNNNPYNSANGGPLERPDQFATDPAARALLERRLNYIVNRWGYSPNLLAWEWWNEVNLAGIPDELLFPWYQEMTAYLKGLDVNQHLVTNSYAISDSSPSWLLPEMEIIQKHEYARQEATNNKDLTERVVADLAVLRGEAPPKPALLGEFGYGDEGYGTEVDKSGIHLHNGLWATTFAGYAGSGMYWWWDVYIEKYGLWYHFRGLDKFLEGIDLATYEPFSPLVISSPDGTPGQAYGLGLQGEDTLVWIRSNSYTVQAVEAAQGGPFRPMMVEGDELTLGVAAEGAYSIYWYDPQTARWLDEARVMAENGRLIIPIPAFNKDLAAKITISR